MVSPSEPGLSAAAINRLLAVREEFLAFLRKRVSTPEAAEDILQSAFVKGIEKGGQLRDEETAVAWFYRLLRNAVIDYYRNRGALDRAQEALLREVEPHRDPDVSLKGEICGCVSGLLANLKPEYRQAIDTVDLQEKSLAELADEAQISANNAAVRVHRAREALRKQVQMTCGMCATHRCIDCDCRRRRQHSHL